MITNDLRKHRCCFTGHRPEKLMYEEEKIKILLQKAVDDAIADGYVTFITGSAVALKLALLKKYIHL
ncbi:MAG: hypothetical protein SOW78_12805 [Clostridia bacterium]|nr:hypothetical protein [Clostridia bacterium]